jgi:spore maturation protein SpmB
MAKLSITFGAILILLGLISYFGISSESITALIPAFLGVPVLILGIAALNEKYLKHSMHAATVLMLLGFLGTSVRVLPVIFSGDEIKNPDAVKVQLIMALICLVFLLLAVRSFIDARRTREDR